MTTGTRKGSRSKNAALSFVPDGTSLRNDGWVYVYYNDKTAELYDMKKDPEQFHNQANNPEYKDIRKEMHKQLQATLITADLRAPALQP